VNIRLGVIVAGAAFVLSLFIGLLSGNGFIALLRALIAAAVFFLLSQLLRAAVMRFFPGFDEAEEAPDEMQSGGRIDISVGDDTPATVTPPAETPPESGISPSGGVDENKQIEYTKEKVDGAAEEAFVPMTFESSATPAASGKYSSSASGKAAEMKDAYSAQDMAHAVETMIKHEG
jgi:hypothetical protein